ncbi:MAG: NAD(P)H-dependent oxidoreductase subunit E, partial [Candidatus Thorarchaeota archaeon]
MTHDTPNSSQVTTVFICRGTGCESSKSALLHELLVNEIRNRGMEKNVHVKKTGCHGFCQQGPLMIIEPDDIFYVKVQEKDIPEIVESHLIQGIPVERLFYIEPNSEEKVPEYLDIPFYSNQERIILRNCGHIDPEEIEDYLVRGGYQGLRKAIFEMTPEEVIEQVLE